MKSGDTFRYQRRKYHVVGFLKDGEETLVITKYYGKWKQWWHYEINHDWEWKSAMESGLLVTNYKPIEKTGD